MARTAYGTGVKVALGGLSVDAVSGRVVTVSGWAACPPGLYCGASGLTPITVSFAVGQPLPSVNTMVGLYGTTIAGSLAPDGFVTTGVCDPFGCW